MSIFIPHIIFQTIYDIPTDYWKEHGIKAILFDIDNTLAPYHVEEPDERVLQYVKELVTQDFKVCVISNNKEARVKVFCEKLSIPYFFSAGKPSGKKIREALAGWHLPAEAAVLVGDQIFTDILGGNRAGVHTILVMPFDQRENIFIKCKRLLEKPFIWAYHQKNKHQ